MLFLTNADMLSTILMIAPIIILFLVFYFFMIKPERKRQQRVYEMQSKIKKNDKIVTIGGIFGLVDDVKEDIVTITVASGARLKIERSAVKQIISE